MENILKKNQVSLIFVFALIFLSACFYDKSSDETLKNEVVDSAEQQKIFEEAKNILFSIPTPLETAMLIQTSGIEFNEKLLNPIDKSSSYITFSQKALNLGVYSVDLSLSSLFHQSQATINYLSTSLNLADDLGLTEGIDKNTLKNFEKNINNRDYILDLISDVLYKTNASMFEEHKNIGLFVFTGVWIEGLYIMTKHNEMSKNENKILVDRIVSQRLTLDQLKNLFDKSDKNKDVAAIENQLNQLKTIFEKISVQVSDPVIDLDSLTGESVIRSSSKYNVSSEVMKELSTKVEEIRKSFVE